MLLPPSSMRLPRLNTWSLLITRPPLTLLRTERLQLTTRLLRLTTPLLILILMSALPTLSPPPMLPLLMWLLSTKQPPLTTQHQCTLPLMLPLPTARSTALPTAQPTAQPTALPTARPTLPQFTHLCMSAKPTFPLMPLLTPPRTPLLMLPLPTPTPPLCTMRRPLRQPTTWLRSSTSPRAEPRRRRLLSPSRSTLRRPPTPPLITKSQSQDLAPNPPRRLLRPRSPFSP
mmetsp:Transcript_806/g.1217  ORF Transcript_806/g.1217 Transcript_806/m.1217 type:complete len:230 (+) Transcript_806:3149-3838(+)